MFWGDIVGNHPELVAEVPARTVALDWDYSADLHDTKSALFKKAGRAFYASPGCCGWDRWINDLDTATANILGFCATRACAPAPPASSTPTGATAATSTPWATPSTAFSSAPPRRVNVRGTGAAAFDSAFNALEIGDASDSYARLLREIGSAAIVPWKQLVLWFDPSPHRPATDWDAATGLPTGILAIDPKQAFAAYERIEKLRAKLARVAANSRPQEDLVLLESLVGARGQALMQALGGLLVCFARVRNCHAASTPPRSPTSCAVSSPTYQPSGMRATARPSTSASAPRCSNSPAASTRAALGMPLLQTQRALPD
jgi:hypothetical protein